MLGKAIITGHFYWEMVFDLPGECPSPVPPAHRWRIDDPTARKAVRTVPSSGYAPPRAPGSARQYRRSTWQKSVDPENRTAGRVTRKIGGWGHGNRIVRGRVRFPGPRTTGPGIVMRLLPRSTGGRLARRRARRRRGEPADGTRLAGVTDRADSADRGRATGPRGRKYGATRGRFSHPLHNNANWEPSRNVRGPTHR